MYKAVGARPTPQWALESTSVVAERLGRDLTGVVIDAPEGGLAACGLLNIAPRLPRPGAHAQQMGYVQWVSTAPQHQRKGYARLVMKHLLEIAQERGIEVVELHASPAGKHLYQDLGFFIKNDNIAMTFDRRRPS